MTSFRIVLLLTVMATPVFGQIEKLLQYELIGKKDQKFVEARIASLAPRDMPSDVACISALLELEIRKVTGSKEIPGMFGMDLNGPVDEKTTANLTSYLLKLKDAGVITERHFNSQLAQINNKQYFHVLQILRGVQVEMFLDGYWDPSKALPYADSLKKYSIVTSHYDQLVMDIKDQKLRLSADLLNYCDHAVVIDTRDYSSEPEKYLAPMYTKMSGVLPDLAFTDFSFEMIEDNSWADKNTRRFDIISSFKSHEKIYKQRTPFRIQSRDEGVDFYTGAWDKRPSTAIFNQVLEDIQSPLRLYTIESQSMDLTRNPTFGIIALTADQAAVLNDLGRYLIPQEKTETRPLTAAEINKALDAYKSIGLLDPSISREVFRNTNESAHTYNELLESIPGLVYLFNGRSSDVKDAYTTLTLDLSKISRGNFMPTEITTESTKRGKLITLHFKLNSTSYKRSFEGYNLVEIELTFFPFINKLPGNKGQFYILPTDSEEMEVIFLTPAQYDFLNKNGLGEIYEIVEED